MEFKYCCNCKHCFDIETGEFGFCKIHKKRIKAYNTCSDWQLFKPTRAEQIQAAAKLTEIVVTQHDTECFVAGAKWADAYSLFDLPAVLGRERQVWLGLCSDVVRESSLSDEWKEQLINAFMRL